MPEGIEIELLLAVGLVVIIGLALFIGRAKRPSAPPGEEPTAVPAPEETAVAPPETVEEAPAEAAPIEAPPPRERPPLRERLLKSRKFLTDRLSEVLGGGADEDTWEDLEAVLIQADLGVETATRVVADLRRAAGEQKLKDPDDVRALLAERLVELFDADRSRALLLNDGAPTVWMVVGVNGTGKTTTIGKLAHDLRGKGHSVALAAADTFRAAADEQLGVWAQRAGATLVKHQPGADPAAVAFDAYAHARAKKIDVLIVDTAGRLHTKTPLMDELSKIRRVVEKEGRVQEALLVIDATSGQNGLNQAQQFASAAGVTGVILTKLDGTAKGGIALSIEETLGIPIKLIGVGEAADDLEPFDPKAFIDALLS